MQPNRVLASADNRKPLDRDYRLDGPHKIDTKDDLTLEAYFVTRGP